MPLVLPDYVTLETAAIFVMFVVTIFLVYKIFRFVIRASIIVVAAFAFPWIIYYLNIPLPITPSIETGIQFALIGLGMFVVYEFAHFIIYFLKIITWPFRAFRKKR